jgi:hypothetical protein
MTFPVFVSATITVQLSVLNATQPSSTTAAVGPSSSGMVYLDILKLGMFQVSNRVARRRDGALGQLARRLWYALPWNLKAEPI